MYSQEDLTENSHEKARIMRIALIPAVIILAGVIASVVIRIEWLSDVLTILLFVELFFIYDLKLKPILAYRRMLEGCTSGKTHEYTGEMKALGDEVCTLDGVSYYPITLCVGKLRNEDDDRLLYFDSSKQLPRELVGSRVTFIVHDKTIVDWKAEALA